MLQAWRHKVAGLVDVLVSSDWLTQRGARWARGAGPHHCDRLAVKVATCLDRYRNHGILERFH